MIIECVLNVSEGRDQSIINAITSYIEKYSGSIVLNVDTGFSANRTVITFIGTADSVQRGAFLAIEKAAELIDMSSHKGEHHRLGAADVCPFIPLVNATISDCVRIARHVGKRVAKELGLPVYLYGHAAHKKERANLEKIRRGGYEGLQERFSSDRWKPDYGESQFKPQFGATIIGARNLLIAYNVNLNTKEVKIARDISLNIRESGRLKRDDQGQVIHDYRGKPFIIPGILQKCKAMGWYIKEFQSTQVSMNLTDFTVTPVHLAFETVADQAAKYDVEVTGSECVGLIPLNAMIQAGRYFLQKEGCQAEQNERNFVYKAIDSLGLSSVKDFNTDERILEYRIKSLFGQNGKVLN